MQFLTAASTFGLLNMYTEIKSKLQNIGLGTHVNFNGKSDKRFLVVNVFE